VLVLLRPSDAAVGGEMPLLARGDSTTPRGAIVATRFMIAEGAHGVTLDSGSVTVARAGAGNALTVHVAGSGMELAGAGRIGLTATFDGVPLASDTVPCQMRP
jgi:hypothetical protein